MKVTRFKKFEQLLERVDTTHPEAGVDNPYSVQSIFIMIDRQVDKKFFDNEGIEHEPKPAPSVEEIKEFVIGLIKSCSLSSRYKNGLINLFQRATDVDQVINYIIRYESGSRG